jgi:hypothetical protein
MATLDTSQANYVEILSEIRKWPIEERLALMHDILETLAPANGSPIPKSTWEQASGLLAGSWPTPLD